jgi:hypothetical protein
MSFGNFLFIVILSSIATTFTIRANIASQEKEQNKAGETSCRVTTPNGSRPRGDSWRAKNLAFTGVRYHGNGKLWTLLPVNGKYVIAPNADGSLEEKLYWWRTARGPLTIQGRRLGFSADPLRATIPCCYEPTGFQASSVAFPTAGCWEMTGRVGDEKLAFVVEVQASAPK